MTNKTERIVFRTTPENKQKIKSKAKEKGLDTSSYSRMKTLEEIAKQEKEAPKVEA